MEELFASYLSDLNLVFLFIIIAALLALISKAADLLVDNSVVLSLSWGVPKIIIGATIVSIGTTLPEASVSVMAALSGNADMALGNAIGSIICDTGLIIGIAGLLGDLPAEGIVVQRQGRLQFWAVLLLALVSMPFFSESGNGNVSQIVGIGFLLLLIAYIFVSIKWSRKESLSATTDTEILGSENMETVNNALILTKLFFGAALVIIGSKILIPTVSITATKLAVPQSVIAATVVAFGTSLPELVTAISAVRKGHGELAVGNIVGADILNVLFVVGAAAAVSPQGLTVPFKFYFIQIPAMLVIVIAFRIFSKSNHSHITRSQALFLALIYCCYLLLNFSV